MGGIEWHDDSCLDLLWRGWGILVFWGFGVFLGVFGTCGFLGILGIFGIWEFERFEGCFLGGEGFGDFWDLGGGVLGKSIDFFWEMCYNGGLG